MGKNSRRRGMKFDAGKIRFDYVPPEALRQLAAAITYGAAKYAPGNWKMLTEEQAVASVMRHVEAHRSGELIDPESGVAHLGCAMAQAAFCLWYRRKELPVTWDFEAVELKWKGVQR